MNRHGIWGAIGAAALIWLGQPAAAETDINFTLDWKFQGPTAAFIVAKEKGYFEEEGLPIRTPEASGPHRGGRVTPICSKMPRGAPPGTGSGRISTISSPATL